MEKSTQTPVTFNQEYDQDTGGRKFLKSTGKGWKEVKLPRNQRRCRGKTTQTPKNIRKATGYTQEVRIRIPMSKLGIISSTMKDDEDEDMVVKPEESALITEDLFEPRVTEADILEVISAEGLSWVDEMIDQFNREEEERLAQQRKRQREEEGDESQPKRLRIRSTLIKRDGEWTPMQI